MIVKSKAQADPLLRFIVLVRPALPWLSFLSALLACICSDLRSAIVFFVASVVALACYLVTVNDWNQQ